MEVDVPGMKSATCIKFVQEIPDLYLRPISAAARSNVVEQRLKLS